MRFLTLVIIAVLVTLAACLTEPPELYEDDPRWNCRTMGNRVCGQIREAN